MPMLIMLIYELTDYVIHEFPKFAEKESLPRVWEGFSRHYGIFWE